MRKITIAKKAATETGGPAKKQLFLNFKGGTGKTTLASSYGYCLAKRGFNVLLLDLDPQAHLTTCLGLENIQHDRCLFSTLVKDEPLKNLIVKTRLPSMDLVPSNISLSSAELSLFDMENRSVRLRSAIESVEDRYDFVIIDAAPNIGLLNLNAIMASDDIIIPVLADFLSFHGLKILLESLASIQKSFSFYLEQIYIIINRYNEAYNICKEAGASLIKYYPDYLLKTVISESQAFIDATSEGQLIFESSPNSKAASEINDLVEEIFQFV